MRVRTEIRTNGNPGISEVYFGARDVAALLGALLTILLTIFASCNTTTNKLAAVETKVDNFDLKVEGVDTRITLHEAAHKSLDEHIIRNTEWIDRERLATRNSTPNGHTP